MKIMSTQMKSVSVKTVLFLMVFVMFSAAIVAQSKENIKVQKKELASFNKVMKSRKIDVQKKYIQWINNDELLYKIAVREKSRMNEAQNIQIATIAIERIQSEKLLERLALFEGNKTVEKRVKINAIKQIQNEEILRKIALKELSGEDGSLNYQAINTLVEKIKNEALLFRIAKSYYDKDGIVSDRGMELLSKIIPKINNEEMIFELIKNLKDEKIVMASLKKITAPEFLKSLVDSSKIINVRIASLYRINDQSILYDITQTNNNYQLKSIAFIKLDDEMLQKMVTDPNTDYTEKSNAMEKIKDQSFLYNLICDRQLSATAFNRITDKDLQSLRERAFKRITDQDVLMQMAQDSIEWEIRQEAFRKLDDASLQKIASGAAKDKALVVAANIRLKNTTWEEEFSNQSSAYLGNVIGAAALVDTPKPTPESVVKACHTYIRRGDTARLPELRDLLLRYGDKTLAEDYLNCGNGRLREAATEWARKNGYNVGSGYGSHRVQWGSGR